MGTLYIVATPIGNLKDITLRALETLKSVDLILAEDTRVAKKLLSHYQISKPVERYDDHARPQIYERIKKLLQEGRKIALVSDAGTPAISDPGAKLVKFIGKAVPIPGPSALIVALSVAGVKADQFTFLGYPPHKKGRQTFFRRLKGIEIRPIVFYESPHRLEKTLIALAETFGPEKEIIIARELTKIYEEIWRGTVKESQNYFKGEKKRGEFVIIVP